MPLDPLSESDVLVPRDPNLPSDDWPDYDFHNAQIDSNGALASLLQATEYNPLRLVGELQLHSIPKSRYSSTVRLKNPGRTANIVVEDVRVFAYGQYEDKSISIWAATKAGWFTLKPSRAYRAVYQEMVEGVRLLYWIADAYRGERKSEKGKNAKVEEPYSPTELFAKYAQDVLGDVDALEKAEEQFYRHRDFLMAAMVQGKEGLDWASNPLYVHLQKLFPLEWENILQRTLGPQAKKAILASRRTRQASVDSASTSSSLKRKRGRPPTRSREPDVISISSSSAASAMPKPRTRTTQSQESGSQRSINGRRTRQHPATPVVEPVSESPEEESSDEEAVDVTPLPEPDDSDSSSSEARPRTVKSALRLKPTKASKGIGPATQSNGTTNPDDEEDDPDERALPSSPLKPANSRHPNAPPSRRHLDEAIDIPSSPSNLTPDPSNPSLTNHVPDPLQTSTWLCALDGCTHKVYLSSLPDSQRLIREHYALHAYDDDARVQLVKGLRAPSLPASYLLDRVKGQARAEGFPGSRGAGGGWVGSRFPGMGVGMKY